MRLTFFFFFYNIIWVILSTETTDILRSVSEEKIVLLWKQDFSI